MLRMVLSGKAESIVRRGHPWVFSDSIQKENRSGQSGDLVAIYDRKNKFLALGLYDANSPIRVRVFHRGKPVQVNREFWRDRLEVSVEHRKGVMEEGTDGLRWLSGENDGFPGLVLDQYGKSLVVKLYSAAWLGRLTELVELFADRFASERVVFRCSRNMMEEARRCGWKDGAVVWGSSCDGPVVFRESGLKFYADLERGQKTGFFLDQRENRRKVESLSSGGEVLNCFSFSGGFSLYAARGGARRVVSVDISEHALRELARNWELNRNVFTGCEHEEIQADVFEWLVEEKRRFDVVVVDPPSLAKRESERAGAIVAYEKLMASGWNRVRAGGWFVACSCSGHVSAEEFEEAVRRVVGLDKGEVLEVRGHAIDHPVTVAELNYLKAVYVRRKGAS